MEKNIITKMKKELGINSFKKLSVIIASTIPERGEGGINESKKISLICLEKEKPLFVVKYPKCKSFSKEYKKKFEKYKNYWDKYKFSFMSEPLKYFEHNGFLCTIEKVLLGKRINKREAKKILGNFCDLYVKVYEKTSRKMSKTTIKKILIALEEIKRNNNNLDSKKLKKLEKEIQNLESVTMFHDCGYPNILKEKNSLNLVDWDELEELPEVYPVISFINSMRNIPLYNIEEFIKIIPEKMQKNKYTQVHLLAYYLSFYTILKGLDKSLKNVEIDFSRPETDFLKSLQYFDILKEEMKK